MIVLAHVAYWAMILWLGQPAVFTGHGLIFYAYAVAGSRVGYMAYRNRYRLGF